MHNRFNTSAIIDIPASSVFYLLGKSPINKDVFMTLPTIKPSEGVEVQAFYNTDYAGGTPVPIYPHDQQENPSSSWQEMVSYPSGIVDIGTLFYNDFIPLGGKFSSVGQSQQQDVYKFLKNTNYCMRLTNLDSSINRVFFTVSWYEK